MGWASANPIFDRTAARLLAHGVDDDVVTDVLAELIDALRDGDWDTLNESLERFIDRPAVVAAFRRAGPDYLFEDEFDGGDDDGAGSGTEDGAVFAPDGHRYIPTEDLAAHPDGDMCIGCGQGKAAHTVIPA